MAEHVRTEKRDRVAIVTIDRAEALNALSAALIGELGETLAGLQSDPGTGAIVLTGAGEKAFVAGADIKEMSEMSPEEARAYSRRGQELFGSIEASAKPVIAAVNGFALGGGCELAMACHMRYASEKARFGQPEVKLGLIPGFGGTQRLTRLVGSGRALEIMLDGGKMLSAPDALSIGLVNAVFPPGEVLDEAVSLAGRILEMGPQACSFVIESVRRGVEGGVAAGLEAENELFGRCFATHDGKEGMAAFLERRGPSFRGD